MEMKMAISRAQGTDAFVGQKAIKPSGFSLEPVAQPRTKQITSIAGRKLYTTLVAAGIDQDLSYSLMSPMDVSFETVATSLAARIAIYPDFIAGADRSTPEILALLGPTGAGKTTTIAKIAALAAFQYNLQVGLVTLGTIQLAAEQLRTYAKIMGIPVRAVETEKQFRSALESLSQCDLILIDTAGKSDGELTHDVDLAGILAGSIAIRKSLVLSATMNPSDLSNTVRRYEPLRPDCLIFTNLDETTSHGPIVSELLRCRLPLAWVTTGRGVPKDIVRLEARQLVDLAIGPEPTTARERLVRDSRNATTRRVSR